MSARASHNSIGRLWVEIMRNSHAQFDQELFVLNKLNFARSGYFIDVGAADGNYLSNTWLLEKKYGWTGILVEPAKRFHSHLFKERNSIISTKCLFSTSGQQLKFVETYHGVLSTLKGFERPDIKEDDVKETYTVESITLNRLLDEHGAPYLIDYLSIDTQGSEFEILKAIDLGRYSFKIITVDHGGLEERDEIYSLLRHMGMSVSRTAAMRIGTYCLRCVWDE